MGRHYLPDLCVGMSKGNQRTLRSGGARTAPSDLQAHVLQLKRGGRDKRGQRIGRLAGRPPCGRIGRREAYQVVGQDFGHTAVVVAPVLLQGNTLVRRRLLAAGRSAAARAARLHATAAATLWSRLCGRTVFCRDPEYRVPRRSAEARLTATQPDRNQAGNEQSHWSSQGNHAKTSKIVLGTRCRES